MYCIFFKKWQNLTFKVNFLCQKLSESFPFLTTQQYAYSQTILISIGWQKNIYNLVSLPWKLDNPYYQRYRWAGSLYSVIILTTFSKQSNYLTFFYHNHFWRKNSEMNHYYWESLKRTCNEENEFSHFCWNLFMQFFFSMHFYYSYPFKIVGLDHKLDSHRIEKYFMHNQQDQFWSIA